MLWHHETLGHEIQRRADRDLAAKLHLAQTGGHRMLLQQIEVPEDAGAFGTAFDAARSPRPATVARVLDLRYGDALT